MYNDVVVESVTKINATMNENNTFYCSFVSIHYIICECGETFPSEDALKEHIEKDPSHINKLPPANAKLEYEEEIIKEYKCGECEEIYDTEEECIEHQEISHVLPVVNEEVVEAESSIPQVPYNKPVTNTKPFTVTSKPLTVSSEPFRVTSQPVNSQLLKLSQPVKRPIVNHDGTVHKPNIITKNDLAKESESNSDDPVVFNQPVTITTKPLTVNVRRRAGRAVKLKTEGKEKKPKIQYSNIKKVVCEVCGKNYASNAALSYHQRVHTGVRPYQCTYCPKNFTMPLFLQIHLRIHTGEKPYQCPHCPKAFTNKAALLRHDRVHTGEKPYECPKCGKSFSQSNSMKLHVLTVHLKLPAPYKSKKRRAESLAREARDRGIRVFDLLDSMDQVQVKSEVDYPNTNEDGEVYHEGYEEVYPKGEEVYPNNSEDVYPDNSEDVYPNNSEDVYPNNSEDVYPDSEQVYPSSEQVYHTENGEVYYYDIPQKEEIAYEIIYEQ